MVQKRISILGVALDTCRLDELIKKILIQTKGAGPTRWVSAVSLSLLAQSHGWAWQPKNPELLKILRNGWLLTAEGRPLAWLSRALGSPIKHQISGADLLPALAYEMAKQGCTLYLLAEEQQDLERAEKNLLAAYPKLKIVGKSAPWISIGGKDLIEAKEQDALILEEINQANPDILALGLASPKQEIWFHRVQSKLSCKVAIGVGGPFTFLSNSVKRTPDWIQNIGCERLWRLSQEPGFQFFRSLYTALKSAWLIFPLLLASLATRLIPKNRGEASSPPLLFLSEDVCLAVVALPGELTQKYVEQTRKQIDETLELHRVILDCKNTKFIDCEGLNLILTILQTKKILLVGLSLDLKLLLKLHRLWDLAGPVTCGNPQILVSRIQPNPKAICDAMRYMGNKVEVSFLGELTADVDYETYLEKLQPIVSLKNTELNFRFCSHISNSGLSFILVLKKQIEESGYKFTVSNLQPIIRQEFRQAQILELLR